jgi:CRISPR/Cas system-associated endonuclease Cas1
LYRSKLPFDGRVQHPATDPVNALLSLGCAMVMGEIRALVEGVGIDSYTQA